MRASINIAGVLLILCLAGCNNSVISGKQDENDVVQNKNREEISNNVGEEPTKDDFANITIPEDTGDYEVFAMPQDLIGAADLIIDGRIIKTEFTEYMNEEGDLSEDARKRITTIEVNNIYKGQYPNSTIEMITVKFDLEAEEPLQEGITYLFALYRTETGMWRLPGVLSQTVYVVGKPTEKGHNFSAQEIIEACKKDN